MNTLKADPAQIEKVRKQYENTPLWMKAPNGMPTKLTEQQWLEVRTLDFIRQFGNWLFNTDTPVIVTEINTNKLFFDWKKTKKIKNWIRNKYQGKNIIINSTELIVGFSSRGLKDALKNRGELQRKTFAVIDIVIKNAYFFEFRKVDDKEKHEHLKGQDIYYSAIMLDNKIYSVKIIFDINKNTSAAIYKGHKTIADKKITPTVYTAETTKGIPPQAGACIISIGELTGHVKPYISIPLDPDTGEPTISP